MFYLMALTLNQIINYICSKKIYFIQNNIIQYNIYFMDFFTTLY